MKGNLEGSPVKNTTLWKLVGFGGGVVYGLFGTYGPIVTSVPFSLLASLLCATLLVLCIIFWRNHTTLLIIRWSAKTAIILLTSITSIGFLLGQMLYGYDPAAAGPGNAALSSGLPQLITIATGLLIIVGIGVSFFRELIGGVLLLFGAGMMQLFFLSFSIPGLDFINPYDVSIGVLGFALLYCWWYRWSISEPAHNTLRL
jgi:hypothetical protein